MVPNGIRKPQYTTKPPDISNVARASLSCITAVILSLLLCVVSGRPTGRKTTLNTIWIRHVVERQNPFIRIIASFVHVMDGHAPTSRATVLQQRIRQFSDGSQIQSRTRGHLLRKNADAALVDSTTQCKQCTERSSGRGTTLASTAGLSTCCDADADRLAFRDADDVITIRERCGVVVCGAPEGVA